MCNVTVTNLAEFLENYVYMNIFGIKTEHFIIEQ